MTEGWQSTVTSRQTMDNLRTVADKHDILTKTAQVISRHVKNLLLQFILWHTVYDIVQLSTFILISALSFCVCSERGPAYVAGQLFRQKWTYITGQS